ncbi:MAG: helix-turn-helix transcriptional regulator [Prevotellaceae bacterium]|nr:helix-turn-helix transcriptional regulator [Prevotellaceae bacterium]
MFAQIMNPTSLNKIGDRIRVCRVERKLSQENVANEIGISITAYSKIERGLTNVSIGRLEQIATCLNVPLARLMHSSAEDIYRNISNINMMREGDYIYPPDINKQALLIRIENLQEEVTRLNKTIVEKDEIIAVLKGVIIHNGQKEL